MCDAIDRMKTRKASDHDGLVAEHFIPARDMLAPFQVHIFNRALCEGFLAAWRENTIVPILKSEAPMDLGNYRAIMISHTLAKMYASILEHERSRWAEA